MAKGRRARSWRCREQRRGLTLDVEHAAAGAALRSIRGRARGDEPGDGAAPVRPAAVRADPAPEPELELDLGLRGLGARASTAPRRRPSSTAPRNGTRPALSLRASACSRTPVASRPMSSDAPAAAGRNAAARVQTATAAPHRAASRLIPMLPPPRASFHPERGNEVTVHCPPRTSRGQLPLFDALVSGSEPSPQAPPGDPAAGRSASRTAERARAVGDARRGSAGRR